ncbi:Thymidylate kinase [Spraguea lophii 42_110]|uniref:dTMP kinase n=1 Tax=Spraguea lophii (strain 42_110) TaxID=1358809 RepID=S7XLZ6_SPRLO|nr:Thymidylate kinase [Spraguea lophii 42_110]
MYIISLCYSQYIVSYYRYFILYKFLEVNFFKIAKIKSDLPIMHGLFIVIEGIDCSGKSTIIRLLKKILEKTLVNNSENTNNLLQCDLGITSIRFPDRTTGTGKILDEHLRKINILNPRTSHLVFSANRWEKEKKIIELKKDNIVLCDRYYYSGIAYTVAQGVDVDWCKMADRGLPKPDILFLIDIKSDVVKDRKGFGSEFYEYEDFQTKVYEILKKVTLEDNAVLVDGSLSQEDIVEKMKDVIMNKLQK